jgi:hypothetical protein
VAATTTVTLTATAGTLTASATITVNPGGGWTITVAGRAVLDDGRALGGAPVRIDPGGHLATTLANGNFTVTGVTTPYDLAVANVAERSAVVYVGLTLTDPVAVVPTRVPVLPPRTGTVAGTVESSTGCNASMDPCTSFVGFGSTYTSGTAPALPGYSISLGWDGPASLQGTLYLLQSSVNASTGATSFWYGSKNGVTVTDGNTTIESWGASSVAPVPTATLAGTGTVASGYWVESASLHLELPLVTLPAAICTASQLPVEPPCAPGPYVAEVPSVVGATLAGVVDARAPGGEMVLLQRSGGQPNATGFDFTIQAAPSQLAPANGTTGVTPSTAFSWTAYPGGVHGVVFSPDAASHPQYMVYTAATTTTLPNLTTLSAELALPAGAGYTWYATGWEPATMDVWASPLELAYVTRFSLGISAGATFTTQ